MGDKLKTTTQAAEELTVNPEQVRRFVKDGELIAINVGRSGKRERLRFEDAEIAAFKLRRQARKGSQCLPSTKTRGRSSTKPTSGSTVLSFAAQQRKRASEKQAAQQTKSKSD